MKIFFNVLTIRSRKLVRNIIALLWSCILNLYQDTCYQEASWEKKKSKWNLNLRSKSERVKGILKLSLVEFSKDRKWSPSFFQDQKLASVSQHFLSLFKFQFFPYISHLPTKNNYKSDPNSCKKSRLKLIFNLTPNSTKT